jgi:hypothetical protein
VSIIYCCQWTTPQFLYTKGGNSYSSLRAFIDKASKPTRDYLSQQVGLRILEAIRLAAQADIPIWMDVRPGDALEQANRLTPSLAPLPLHPHFNKTEQRHPLPAHGSRQQGAIHEPCHHPKQPPRHRHH